MQDNNFISNPINRISANLSRNTNDFNNKRSFIRRTQPPISPIINDHNSSNDAWKRDPRDSYPPLPQRGGDLESVLAEFKTQLINTIHVQLKDLINIGNTNSVKINKIYETLNMSHE